VQAGITPLSPTYWTTASITQQSFQILLEQEGYEPSGVVDIRSWWEWEPPIGNVGGIVEYGAVEKFSGYSAIEPNYVVVVDDNSATTDPGPFNKLQLRIQRTQEWRVLFPFFVILDRRM